MTVKSNGIIITLTVLLLFVYAVISGLYISKVSFPNVLYVDLLLALCLYFLFRDRFFCRFLVSSLILIALLQAVFIVLQALGLFTGKNLYYSSTGFFHSPAIAAIIQSLAGTLLFCYLKDGSLKRANRICLSLLLLLLVVSICITGSRAALISLVFGFSLLWISDTSDKRIKKKRALISIFVLSLSIPLLCLIRMESIPGRILSQVVSLFEGVKTPLFGHGICRFNDVYMMAQADFLDTIIGERFSLIADDICFPYNDLLRVFVELGLTGVLLIAVLLVLTCVVQRDARKLSPLVVYCVFAIFSFPSFNRFTALLFPVLLGYCHSDMTVSLGVRQKFFPENIVATIIMLCLSLFIRQSFSADIRSIYRGAQVDVVSVKKHFSYVRNDTYMNQRMLYALKYNQNLVDSYFIDSIHPSFDSFLLFGQIKYTEKQYDLAEYYLHYAKRMAPNRVMPKYWLWRVYIEQGAESRAEGMANEVLSLKSKTIDTRLLRVKHEMKKYFEGGTYAHQ